MSTDDRYTTDPTPAPVPPAAFEAAAVAWQDAFGLGGSTVDWLHAALSAAAPFFAAAPAAAPPVTNDWIPLREVRMVPFETPPEVLERARRAAQQVAMELEAAVVPVMTATYRDGWADGYLARQREIEETT